MEETKYFSVTGMHCAACATRIEKTISKIDGVKDIHVNLATEKGRVTFYKKRTNLKEIFDKIRKIGFEAKAIAKLSTEGNPYKEIKKLQQRFFLSALLTIPLAWAMFDHFTWASFIQVPALLTEPLLQLILTIPIQFIIGFPFYERAWKAVKSGHANMDVLVVLSTSAAFFYSHYLTFTTLQSTMPPPVLYFETSAFIITFILLGKLLEAKTKLKTTEALKNLYQLQTKTATLYENGREFPSPVQQLVPGDILIIKAGEKIPIDGEVIFGSTMVNESLLTGESIPVEKAIGSPVYAGTINHHGLLRVKVTTKESETTLSQIIQIVEEAQNSKAPIQQTADQITAIFVPIVLIIATMTFLIWYLSLQPDQLGTALEKTIAVLIIACPCALGLATPTSVMVGSGRAAQMGILFKEGKNLEVLGKCRTIILDKTGTLTEGKPHVTNIQIDSQQQEEVLKLVGAVEQGFNHPIAKAIVSHVQSILPSLPTAEQVQTIPGHGVEAKVLGKKVVIANPSYQLHSLSNNQKQQVKKLESAGKTVMIIWIDTHFAGIIAVADQLRNSSAPAVARLKRLGLKPILLTGDNPYTGMAVAKQVGIQKLQTGLSPIDKAHIIQSLQKKGEKVIMVGDGMNDAPALAVADIGIAIGSGSDIAIESGDVTIIQGDLHRLVDAIQISKKTMTNIKQNFLWAFLYNLVMIPFAMLGLLAPWLAGAAMAFSSVSVVLNALRLKKLKLH
ncbi:heavy metal translocating P-type ATPase [Lederbergia galactosidilytica]|uniref:P-type Cu(+) transporter n=1 Tax=Lederbergia galactosidilytica TaxID=217031 RepID=A0A177ZJS8_9BACI|nr:heavy metal translocating P-type ATPase [Lederbergia galactosidilytica]KRG15191.1 ATPase P [Virgibacillus soli]OAK67843.1 ATPase P [Lederbergia galactosidilytica]